MNLAGTGQSWCLSPRNGARAPIMSYDAQVQTLCCLYSIPLAVMSQTGIIIESLPVLLAPAWLFLIQSKTGSFTKICSRMHVSIITELMRTMTPLLACIHLSLNPQPRAIMIKTMMVAIVIPSSTIVSVSSSACSHFNCL